MKKPIQKSKPHKINGLSDERLKAFGINPKKYLKKLKYGPDTTNQTKQQPMKQNSNNFQKNKAQLNKKQEKSIKIKETSHKNKLKKILNASNQ